MMKKVVEVQALMTFEDVEAKTTRKHSEKWKTTLERAKFLASKKFVSVLSITSPERAQISPTKAPIPEVKVVTPKKISKPKQAIPSENSNYIEPLSTRNITLSKIAAKINEIIEVENNKC